MIIKANIEYAISRTLALYLKNKLECIKKAKLIDKFGAMNQFDWRKLFLAHVKKKLSWLCSRHKGPLEVYNINISNGKVDFVTCRYQTLYQ